MFSRPSSEGSRPSSITRSIRESFTSELEILPPDMVDDLKVYEEDVASEIEEGTYENLTSDQDRESGRDSKASKRIEEESKQEETELERKIRRGLKKINKLDKILLRKVQREKEIKKERLALEKDFQQQVQSLIQEKGLENVVGSQQLLSLCAAIDSQEETFMEDDEFVDPIFATQIDSEHYQDGVEATEEKGSVKNVNNSKKPEEDGASQKKTSANAQSKVDFIKRNINLAAHANEVIALTDEEKKRLEELLADDKDLLVGENPFSTPSLKCDGFQFSIDDQQTLEGIDARLRDFLSDEEFNSAILSQSQTSISTKADGNNDVNSDIYTTDSDRMTQCGERVLNDEINQRSVVQRLSDIEKKLEQLRLTVDSPTCQTIDPDLLRSLLEVNSRMTSDSKSICDSLRSNSQLYCDDDSLRSSSQLFADDEKSLQSNSQLYANDGDSLRSSSQLYANNSDILRSSSQLYGDDDNFSDLGTVSSSHNLKDQE